MGVDTTETVQRMTFGKPGACQNTNFSFSLTMHRPLPLEYLPQKEMSIIQELFHFKSGQYQ